MGIGYISIDLLLVPSYPGKICHDYRVRKGIKSARKNKACSLSVLKRKKRREIVTPVNKKLVSESFLILIFHRVEYPIWEWGWGFVLGRGRRRKGAGDSGGGEGSGNRMERWS